MATGTITSTITIGGRSVAATNSVTDTGLIEHALTLTAADAGTLSTRTDNDTGIITLAEGHGITDSNTVDVYWSGGVRYGMTVTAYDTTTITVDVGSGDNLPVQDTAVYAGVHTTVDVDVNGSLATMIVITADARAHIEFLTGASASIKAVEIASASYPFSWDSNCGHTNPITGQTVASARASAGTAASTTMYVWILYTSAS